MAIPVPSASAAGNQLAFDLKLSAALASQPTTARLHITFPDGSSGKPRPARRITISLPDGTTFDEGAVAVCHATDQDLQMEGSSACPVGTGLGYGTATAITGFGPPFDPTAVQVHGFHLPGQLVNVYTLQGLDRPSVHLSHARIVGSSFVEDVPNDPGGPPDGRTTARSFDDVLQPDNLPGRSFVTTPPACPPGGEWVSRLAIVWDDDGSTQSATSTTPCEVPRAPAPAVEPRKSPCKGLRRGLKRARTHRARSRIRAQLRQHRC